MEIATILGPPIRTFNNRGHCKAGRGVRPGGLVTNWRWNMNTVKNKSHEASQVKQLVTGTIKHYPNASAELVFGGATRTVSALTELLQSFVDLRSAVVASQAATKAKVAAERAEAPALLPVIREYVAFVRATFGNSPDALAPSRFVHFHPSRHLSAGHDDSLAQPTSSRTPSAYPRRYAAAMLCFRFLRRYSSAA